MGRRTRPSNLQCLKTELQWNELSFVFRDLCTLETSKENTSIQCHIGCIQLWRIRMCDVGTGLKLLKSKIPHNTEVTSDTSINLLRILIDILNHPKTRGALS